jgi:hypothetical protein
VRFTVVPRTLLSVIGGADGCSIEVRRSWCGSTWATRPLGPSTERARVDLSRKDGLSAAVASMHPDSRGCVNARPDETQRPVVMASDNNRDDARRMKANPWAVRHALAHVATSPSDAVLISDAGDRRRGSARR